MKRTVLVSFFLFGCISLSAQSRGEMYVSASLGVSSGNRNAEYYDGAYTTKKPQPLSTSLSAQAEFGYFVVNHLRLALAVGVPYNSTPNTKSGDTWLRTNIVGIQINPNVAYYVKLADRFYYTPEIGVSVGFGSYKEDLTANSSYNAKYKGWDVYANILAFEFRVCYRFALWAGVSQLSYGSVKIADKSSSSHIKNGQFSFNMNDASVGAKFYF